MAASIRKLLEEFLPALDAWAKMTSTRFDDLAVDGLRAVLGSPLLFDWLLERLLAADRPQSFYALPPEIQNEFGDGATAEAFVTQCLPVLQAAIPEVLARY